MALIFEELSHAVIGAGMELHRGLGHGFLESVYSEGLAHEFRLRQIPFRREVSLPVYYKGQFLGQFKADFVVDDRMIVELKAVSSLADTHFSQVKNYLSATGYRLALLLNYGAPSLEYPRIVNPSARVIRVNPLNPRNPR